MTAQALLQKYNIKIDVIEIPNTGRYNLAEFLSDLDFKIGVEVGVAAGEYSEILMKFNPQFEAFYGIDPYSAYKGYKDYVRSKTFDLMKADAHKRLDEYPQYKFIEKFSVDAAKDFEDESLDFVYLDGNHSEPFVSEDIRVWYPKVKKDGILAGHDYARIRAKNGEASSNWAVMGAVNRFVKENDLQLYVWGLEAKIPGLVRDPIRSWMIIK